MKIAIADMMDLARGATFLGTGGGGDPYSGRLFAEQMIHRHGAPEMVSVADVPDDAACYIIAMMGAPTVIVEKLMNGKMRSWQSPSWKASPGAMPTISFRRRSAASTPRCRSHLRRSAACPSSTPMAWGALFLKCR
jgi:hypothetical protein